MKIMKIMKEDGVCVTRLTINGEDYTYTLRAYITPDGKDEVKRLPIASILFPDNEIPYWGFTYENGETIYATGQITVEISSIKTTSVG